MEEIYEDNDNVIQPVPISGSIMDSRTSQLDDALSARLEDAIHQETAAIVLHDITKIGSEYQPIDLAHAVCRLPRNARHIVYDNLPDLNAKVDFFINTNSSTRSAIFRHITDKEVKVLLEKMPLDEAVWIIDDMSDRRSRKVMELLDPKKRIRIRELQKHDRHSAGRLMNDEFFAFDMNNTIGEVSAFIRDNPGIELTRRVFVVDEDGKLIGYVPDRNLIVNMAYVPIRQVMRPIMHQVDVEASRDEVVDVVERYKIPALPVVDRNDLLVGVIAYEDVVEAMEDIADETIASIAGTAEDVSEHEPIYRRFFWRAPWLVVTICAGLVSATIMAHFSGPTWFAIVPFFVPLITGMSGNVGIQCSTVLVRGMSTGELSSGTRNEAIVKELGIGLMIGTIFGLMCGTLIFLLNHFSVYQNFINPLLLGLTVGGGVLCACLTATLLGTLSPFFFVKFGVDPAVASGPIVTAFNDVLSFLIFILVARGVHLLITG